MNRTNRSEDLIQAALAAHRAGRLHEAEPLYRRALEESPGHPDAHYLLGVVALQTGRHDTAIEHIERALQMNPGSAECHYNLGLAYSGRGIPAKAESHFRRAVELEPDYAEAHNNLANALREQDELDEATSHYRIALQINPAYHAARGNLANLLEARGRTDEALEHYRKALELNPNSAQARCDLGNALRTLGRLEDAVDEYRKAISMEPGIPAIHYHLGLALRQLKQYDAAAESYLCALRIDPDSADVHNNLGIALELSNRREEAIAHYRNALALDAEHTLAHYNLGNALRCSNRFVEAAKSFNRALEINPEWPEAHAALGTTFREQGLLDDSLASLDRSLELLHDPISHSGLILTLNSHPGCDAASLLREARQWNARYVESLGLPRRGFSNDRSCGRRLKVGYLSADFRCHPVGWFFAPVIRAHDKRDFEITCYSGVECSDALTEEFARHADHWKDVADSSDDALAEIIREDGIDIVVELSGHTAGNRLLTLARKPAPIRICGGGHYGTTGVDGVDYLLADGFHAPEGSDSFYSERLIRLPNDYVCYEPPSYAPRVAQLPALEHGYITFGCCNNLSKLTANVFRLWSEVLKRVPGSRIRLQTAALKESATRERVRGMLIAHGIEDHRIDLDGPVGHRKLLDNYRFIDIALDPFPYSGGLTTCESLWMGVPVITLSGVTFAGRHSTSHLSNVGLENLIAKSEKEYISIASRLAANPEELLSVRRNLRSRMAASPLCDTKRYTRDLEDAYRRIWEKWCASVRRDRQ